MFRGTMCSLNRALEKLVYTPDRDFNTEFGQREALVANVTQYPDTASKGRFKP
jgi:hypothetical protein